MQGMYDAQQHNNTQIVRSVIHIAYNSQWKTMSQIRKTKAGANSEKKSDEDGSHKGDP